MSAFYNARQGYPFEQGILSPSRLNGAGTVFIVLDPIGDQRLPNFQNVDFHVERPVRFGGLRLIPSLDVFNVSNSNTIQAIRGTQNTGMRPARQLGTRIRSRRSWRRASSASASA